jgi:hypothetical protein
VLSAAQAGEVPQVQGSVAAVPHAAAAAGAVGEELQVHSTRLAAAAAAGPLQAEVVAPGHPVKVQEREQQVLALVQRHPTTLPAPASDLLGLHQAAGGVSLPGGQALAELRLPCYPGASPAVGACPVRVCLQEQGQGAQVHPHHHHLGGSCLQREPGSGPGTAARHSHRTMQSIFVSQACIACGNLCKTTQHRSVQHYADQARLGRFGWGVWEPHLLAEQPDGLLPAMASMKVLLHPTARRCHPGCHSPVAQVLLLAHPGALLAQQVHQGPLHLAVG